MSVGKKGLDAEIRTRGEERQGFLGGGTEEGLPWVFGERKAVTWEL